MSFTDPDPVPQFPGDTLLERIARAYEEAVDAYGNAADDAALKENAYLRAFAEAWAVAVEDGVAATVRSKHCDNQADVVEKRTEWNRAVAAEKRCRAKSQELQNRLTACQSHVRFIREGT